MRWLVFVQLLAGTIAFNVMGDSPGWRRTVVAALLGIAVGIVGDIAIPAVLQLPSLYMQRYVLIPLYGPYGLSVYIVLLPFAIVGAAVAARHNWNPQHPPGDLRN